MCAQENFLQQILGLGPPDHPARQAEQPRRMDAVQLLEPSRVAIGAPLCEGHIGMRQHVNVRRVRRGHGPEALLWVRRRPELIRSFTPHGIIACLGPSTAQSRPEIDGLRAVAAWLS
jgi:hypothetical protein